MNLLSGKSITSEYPVVIVVESPDIRLLPFKECNSFLPIANRPLITYQLDLLEKCGVAGGVQSFILEVFSMVVHFPLADVFIVAAAEYQQRFAQYLKADVRVNVTVHLIIVDELIGSVDGLRAVKDKIKVVCMNE